MMKWITLWRNKLFTILFRWWTGKQLWDYYYHVIMSSWPYSGNTIYEDGDIFPSRVIRHVERDDELVGIFSSLVMKHEEGNYLLAGFFSTCFGTCWKWWYTKMVFRTWWTWWCRPTGIFFSTHDEAGWTSRYAREIFQGGLWIMLNVMYILVGLF